MLPNKRMPSHPGKILREEFLKPMGLTQIAFARHVGIPLRRVNEIIRGKRGMTPESAWLFAKALNTSTEFWMNLQMAYDLTKARPEKMVDRFSQSSGA